MNYKKTSELKNIIHDFLKNYELPNIFEQDIVMNEMVECIQITYTQLYPKNKLSNDFIKELILKRKPIIPIKYTDQEINKIKKQIEILKTIKQPEQRTEEWYEYRNNRLTASDLATAIHLNPYGDRKKLITSKCGHKHDFIKGAAIMHGVKCEPIATYFYEKLNSIKIFEYGCIPHPHIAYFGASPDGICEYTEANEQYSGRMLEIKCPKSRDLNGYVPGYYELQIQGQLEVCDLEYCDYLECVFKECDTLPEYLKIDSIFKTVILEFYNNTTKNYEYKYGYDFDNKEKIESWEEEHISKFYDNIEIDYMGTTYMYLKEYDVILVKRDKERFETIKLQITQFWNEVLHYRKNGYQELLPKKKEYKSKEYISKESNIEFLDDSD